MCPKAPMRWHPGDLPNSLESHLTLSPRDACRMAEQHCHSWFCHLYDLLYLVFLGRQTSAEAINTLPSRSLTCLLPEQPRWHPSHTHTCAYSLPLHSFSVTPPGETVAQANIPLSSALAPELGSGCSFIPGSRGWWGFHREPHFTQQLPRVAQPQPKGSNHKVVSQKSLIPWATQLTGLTSSHKQYCV